MVEVYPGSDDRWYWRYRSKNRKITADGSEGYASKSNAKRAARRAGVALAFAKIKVING